MHRITILTQHIHSNANNNNKSITPTHTAATTPIINTQPPPFYPLTSHLTIRQIALVAKNLQPNISQLKTWLECSDPQNGFKDPHIHQLGLMNTVLCLDGTFLETVSPLEYDSNNTASLQLKRRFGDGGYMVMLQTSSIEMDKKRLHLLDNNNNNSTSTFKVVLKIDDEHVHEIHLHPKDTNKCIFSITENRSSYQGWHWGGPNWEQHASKIGKIHGAILQVNELNNICIQRFTQLLNCTPNVVQMNKTDCKVIFNLGNEGQRLQIIQAKDGRGDGLHGLEILMNDRNKVNTTITMCGIVIYCI
jgi:hypothetical protein